MRAKKIFNFSNSGNSNLRVGREMNGNQWSSDGDHLTTQCLLKNVPKFHHQPYSDTVFSSAQICKKVDGFHDLVLHISSRNPIAVWTIEQLISSVSNCRVSTWVPNQPSIALSGNNLLLIDISSIKEWPEVVSKSTSGGYKSILLVPNTWGATNGAVIRALHIGVRGIVCLSREFPNQLWEAIACVARGHMAVKAEILEEFYTGRRCTKSRSCISGLSMREEQVRDLLIEGFSNKTISTVLGITERTTKFHVSNVLHKLQVKTRKQLSQMSGSIAESVGKSA